jgi:hypothetical protein
MNNTLNSDHNAEKKELPIMVSAFKDAMLIDLPLAVFMGGNPLLTLVGSTIGYGIRKCINSNAKAGDFSENETIDKISLAAATGVPGGFLKYTISKKSFASGKFGVLNNFLYELVGPGKVCVANSPKYCSILDITAIETVEELAKLAIGDGFSYSGITKALIGSFHAAAVIEGSLYAFSEAFDNTYFALSESPFYNQVGEYMNNFYNEGCEIAKLYLSKDEL